MVCVVMRVRVGQRATYLRVPAREVCMGLVRWTRVGSTGDCAELNWLVCVCGVLGCVYGWGNSPTALVPTGIMHGCFGSGSQGIALN